eukprot:gene9819-5940_t
MRATFFRDAASRYHPIVMEGAAPVARPQPGSRDDIELICDEGARAFVAEKRGFA